MDSIDQVSQGWANFDVDSKKHQLDTQAQQIATWQSTCAGTRKTLATDTKAFRKLPLEEKTQKLPGLLKSYQQEIDRLTKRAQFSETSLLHLIVALSELQDPVVFLNEFATTAKQLAQVSDARDALVRENQRLTKQNDELLKENVANAQKLTTMEALKVENEQIKKDLKDIGESQVSREKSKWEAQQALLAADMSSELALAKSRVEELESANATLQRTHEQLQAQVFDAQTQFSEELLQKQAEIDALKLKLDLESDSSGNAKLAKFGNNPNAKNPMANHHGEEEMENHSGTTLNPLEDSAYLSTLKEEKERLALELAEKEWAFARLENESSNDKRTIAALVKELETTKTTLEGENAELKDKLSAVSKELAERPTRQALETLEKKWALVQAIQPQQEADQLTFGALTVDGGGEFDFDMGESGSDDIWRDPTLLTRPKHEAVEMLLKDKVRQLESQLARVTVFCKDAQQVADEQRQRLADTRALLRERDAVITQLEQSLLGENANSVSETNVNSGNAGNSGNASATSALPSTPVDHEKMLHMVCRQRDRFKSRLLDLEKENTKILQQLHDAMARIAKLQSEGVKKGFQSGRTLVSRTQPEPYDKYAKKEVLSGVERSMVSVNRLMMSNKVGRLFVFGYGVMLHVVIMFVLYKLVHTKHGSVCDHDFVQSAIEKANNAGE